MAENRPSPRPKPPDNSGQGNDDDDRRTPNWVRNFLIIAVTGVWVASYIIGLFNPDIKIPEQVNVLFSSMVGVLLLNAASKRRDE